jgi:hypothetical protein
MDEIIEVYGKQLVMYLNIKELLLELKGKGYEEAIYESKLQDINYIMNNIGKLNERAEQLKQIYVLRHRIDDFTGIQIKKVETEENYDRLKVVVDKIAEEIKAVKKLQDEVTSRINKDAEEAWQRLKEFNINKKNFDKYEKSYNSKVSNKIDIKK